MSVARIDGSAELKRLTNNINFIRDKVLRQVTSQAINKTIAKAKTESSRAIREEANITKRISDRSLVVSRSNVNRLVASIDARQGRANNLIENVTATRRNSRSFRRRSKRSGYLYSGVQAKPYETKKVFQGTFIAKGKTSGKLLVFARTGPNRNSKLKSIFGPSLRKIFKRDDVQQRIKAKVDAEFRVEFERALLNKLRKLK